VSSLLAPVSLLKQCSVLGIGAIPLVSDIGTLVAHEPQQGMYEFAVICIDILDLE
jgi:hypothetical protein